MVNQVFIDDKKIKDILTYISGMRHAEMIRMMFLCSLNGMRSINFAYLQVGDVYTPDLKVKDVICLDKDKNKGKFGCSYYLNTQMKKLHRNCICLLRKRWESLSIVYQFHGCLLVITKSSILKGHHIWGVICSCHALSMLAQISVWFKNSQTIVILAQPNVILIITRKCSQMLWRISQFRNNARTGMILPRPVSYHHIVGQWFLVA